MPTPRGSKGGGKFVSIPFFRFVHGVKPALAARYHGEGGARCAQARNPYGANIPMRDDRPPVTLLERREIEARIVGPLVRGFAEELGEEKALEVVRRVVAALAREAGAELARGVGEATLTAFASCLDQWKAGGALEIDLIAQDDQRLDFNVKRCRYAELYRSLGLADLGSSLSCCRDFALVEGFNPQIQLTRTHTIMEGADHCDFRFRTRDAGEPAG